MDAEYRFRRLVAEFRQWKDYDHILTWVLSQNRISPAMMAWLKARGDDYRSEL